jgi:hypothetical protein
VNISDPAPRSRMADAGTGAGDDRNLVCQQLHVDTPQ